MKSYRFHVCMILFGVVCYAEENEFVDYTSDNSEFGYGIPNLQQHLQPNLQQHYQPNLQQHLQPNLESNLQPNLQPEGADYLRNVINQLHHDRLQTQSVEIPDPGGFYYTQRVHEDPVNEIYGPTQIYNISGPTPVPDIEAQIIPQSPPPLELSKDELLKLYEAAVVKATQLQGGPKPEDEYKLPLAGEEDSHAVKPALQGQMGDPVSGYYYYYFPIKSFYQPTPPPTKPPKTTTPSHQHLHATITMMDSPNNKAVEPLFMAISGFIGMALVFLFSVLFAPRFGKLRSKNVKEGEAEVANIGHIFLAAMAGEDCSERLACEIARIFRGLKSDSKTLRVLEIVLPPTLSHQVSQIRKAAGKKAKCGYIQCKVKKNTTDDKPPIKTYKIKLKPIKPETPHDWWVNHFDKDKPIQVVQYWQEQREEPLSKEEKQKLEKGKRPQVKEPPKFVKNDSWKQQQQNWHRQKQEEKQQQQQWERFQEEKLTQFWRRQWEQQKRQEQKRKQQWERRKEQLQKEMKKQQTKLNRESSKTTNFNSDNRKNKSEFEENK